MSDPGRYLIGAPGKHTRPKTIELRQLTVLQEYVPVLHEITLDIFEGESTALVGTSEREKHALLACILGQMQPTQGDIHVLGATLPPLPAALRRRLGVTPRLADRQARETVAASLRRFAAYHELRLTDAQITRYCAHYQLTPTAQVAELSELQIRVLALALALVHDPRLALLLEPLTGLIEADQAALQAYLQRIQSEGRTLLTTFTPPLAEKFFTGYDLVVRLAQGRLQHLEHEGNSVCKKK